MAIYAVPRRAGVWRPAHSKWAAPYCAALAIKAQKRMGADLRPGTPPLKTVLFQLHDGYIFAAGQPFVVYTR